ncbi:hypothetical protein BN1723_014242 [Verticillium longisporum]|uniref:Uncharacterized protein n=1 Tax=Verticillium longisporum TaxID=100787 RepID=A0A0G4M4E1_VERLO|nr:hypothetical protein BN1723_014242 [Verticillium longisporum]
MLRHDPTLGIAQNPNSTTIPTAMNEAEHLKECQLGEEEKEALVKAKPTIGSLLSPVGERERTSDPEKLREACKPFINAFKPWEGYTLPVPDPPVLLIPIDISDEARVGGKKIHFGTYVYLTQSVNITPNILFLLLKEDQ